MILHSIRLTAFEMEKGAISFSLLTKLACQLEKIAESTLRLYVEGSSHLKPGKIPDWIRQSVNFQLSGIQKGSTILTIEAPILSDTLKGIQYPLFNEFGNEDYSNDSALSLAMLAYQKAISEERNTELLDKHLLGEMLKFKEILSRVQAEVEMECPSVSRKVILTGKSFENIGKLEVITPPPMKIKLSGKLDVLKHSHSMVEIISQHKRVKIKLPETITFDQLKMLFGQDVSIIGIANFNPAHQMVSVLLSEIQPAGSEDSFFRNVPELIKEKTDIKQLIVKQKYTGVQEAALDKLVDKLAIDDPIEDLLSSLK